MPVITVNATLGNRIQVSDRKLSHKAMNHTRIQVPLTLSEPHFEDESTVVSARRVVPLSEARMNDRWRKVLTLLPIFLAATLCGALGAIAVNYLEGRQSAPMTAVQPAALEKKAEQPSAEPSPVALTASTAEGATMSDSVEAEASQSSDDSTRESASAAQNSDLQPNSAKADTAEPKKKISSTDPRQLIRQRRVHQPPTRRVSQNDEPKPGAGRIQEIFSGPNP